MASSADHHHLPTPFAATGAPPPTPSNLTPQSTTPDFLSHLLHRLPPTLSFSHPTRRSSPLSSSTPSAAPTTAAPSISLSDPTPSLLSAATQSGFFHLTHHTIPSHLPPSAESAAVSLFNLPHHRKQLLFPGDWPLGHDVDDDDDSASATESFCFDSAFSADSANDLELDSLRELTRELEKLGLNILEELASAVGFDNPARNDLCSLMWVSDGIDKPGRVYPYVLALHYQIRCEKQSLLSDSGWVSVMGQADSVFVALGDIAQVWSNGKLKKVRGRPFPNGNEKVNSERCITICLLITLPLESTISPLLPNLQQDDEESSDSKGQNTRMFNSFSFEDYAWRLYHQPLLLKDPLLRYRNLSS